MTGAGTAVHPGTVPPAPDRPARPLPDLAAHARVADAVDARTMERDGLVRAPAALLLLGRAIGPPGADAACVAATLLTDRDTAAAACPYALPGRDELVAGLRQAERSLAEDCRLRERSEAVLDAVSAP